MKVHHPNAVRDTPDDVDSAVTLGGESISIADDGTLECSEAQARTLARLYDVALSDIRVGDDADSDADEPTGTCDVVKNDGEVCGRDRPCAYHDD